jgi:DNA-directed RNA polymerase specialized sigma24 family protein
MARRQLAGQHGHTLDATALVHEAYLKLVGRNTARFDDRAHFFAYAASAMRSVVVDYARQRLAQKRGGDLHRVTDLPEDLEGGLRLDEDTLAWTPR